MRIAPLADVKAHLSAYFDECVAEGPLVITRNGKAVAVLLVPYDDDDLETYARSVRDAHPGRHGPAQITRAVATPPQPAWPPGLTNH